MGSLQLGGKSNGVNYFKTQQYFYCLCVHAHTHTQTPRSTYIQWEDKNMNSVTHEGSEENNKDFNLNYNRFYLR